MIKKFICNQSIKYHHNDGVYWSMNIIIVGLLSNETTSHVSHVFFYQIDGLAQDWSNSIANAPESIQSCNEPPKFAFLVHIMPANPETLGASLI